MMLRFAVLPVLALLGCTANTPGGAPANSKANSGSPPAPSEGRPFTIERIAQFDAPWAMTFLPGGRQALITEKAGALKLWTVGGSTIDVAGVPTVDQGGQGGFGDVILDPDFARNNRIYMSWVEAGEGNVRGAVAGRARLVIEGGSARLDGLQMIWRQAPKVSGRGHFSHRLAFSPDGQHLFISSGDRQAFTPAQDMSANLGKILRLNPDGTIPSDNPFAAQGGVAAQIWSLGHRNPLGLAFAPDGRLWEHEMGPAGGDEYNRIERGSNYGYPIVSDGDHYDGRPIPDHSTRPEFNAPEIVWTPVISPSSLIFYSGNLFRAWRGSALIGALSGKALVRVEIDGDLAREVERWPMEQRIREVEQAPDGSIYLLEDRSDAGGGRLLRLVPRR